MCVGERMKLTIERSALLKALGHVQNVVEKRTTIPILSNILLVAADGELALTATDLDMEATDRAPAGITMAGSVTAPAQTLFDVARKLPDGADVEIEYVGESQRLTIAAGASRFSLPTLPASDFQTMAREEAPVRFEITASDLVRLIDKTRFAISTEETRFYLNGVYLHAAPGPVLRTVATDGHRLALAEMPAPSGAEALKGVIVPRKAVGEIRRIAEDADTAIQMEVSEARITVRAGAATLTSKLIDGAFPDYERVIPRGNDKKAVIDNARFAVAVDRVQTVSGERSKSVKMSFADGMLVLTVNHAETGQARDEMEAVFPHDGLEIGFNARYLLDVTQQIEGPEAEFAFSDANSPALVIDPADPGARYVLMPLRV